MCDTEWSIDLVLTFLELYRCEPIIYDPKYGRHKNRGKVYEAWDRISQAMGIPVIELKKKRDALMATFRGLVRKKEASMKLPNSEIYEPTWFAYDLMAGFLLPVYRSNGLHGEHSNQDPEISDFSVTVKSEFKPEFDETLDESHMHSAASEEMEDLLGGPLACDRVNSRASSTSSIASLESGLQINMPQIRSSFLQQSLKRKRSDETFPLVERPRRTSQQTPSSTVTLPLPNPPDDSEQEDECDLYCKLLAKKLRRLPEEDRELIMYEIDGLFINRRRRMLPDCTPSQAEPLSPSSS